MVTSLLNLDNDGRHLGVISAFAQWIDLSVKGPETEYISRLFGIKRRNDQSFFSFLKKIKSTDEIESQVVQFNKLYHQFRFYGGQLQTKKVQELIATTNSCAKELAILIAKDPHVQWELSNLLGENKQ